MRSRIQNGLTFGEAVEKYKDQITTFEKSELN